MTFRPIDETAFAADRALSAEHGRRIARDTAEIISERCVQSGGAFRRYAGDGSELRTLWRWAANWGYIGPFEIFVPPQVAEQGFVRMLIGARTNGGDGNVRVYAINEAQAPDEATMTTDTASGAPGSESAWYVCESDVGASDFDFALLMPVRAGWNQCWIAILCDEDADRTPEIFATGTDYVLQAFGGSLGVPTVDGVVIVDNDPVGMVVDVATSAGAYAAGASDRFTVGALIDTEDPVLFEMTVSELESTYSGVRGYPYCRVSWVVPLYIDSISFDGSASVAFNGAAFRYLQPVSAGFTRMATDAAQNAHLARLPMSAVVAQLSAETALADDETGRLRLLSLIGTADTDIPIACLGLGKATPDIDLQGTFSGSWTYEARLSAVLFLFSGTPSAPVDVEFSLVVVDSSGADIVAGSVTVIPVPVSNYGGDRTAEENAVLAGISATSGVSNWLLEGMSTRSALSQRTSITVRVTVTDDLDAEPVQRLVLRVATTVDRGTTALFTSPIAVRLTDGN